MYSKDFQVRKRRDVELPVIQEQSSSGNEDLEEKEPKEERRMRSSTQGYDSPNSRLTPASVVAVKNFSFEEESLYEDSRWSMDDLFYFRRLKDKLDSIRLGDAYKGYRVEERHRARMIDWMIEVLCTYRNKHNTIFRSILLMDLYISKNGKELSNTKLHLLGLCSLFIASKLEEVDCIKIGDMVDVIGYRRFSEAQILKQELDLVSTIRFKLGLPTLYELFCVQNKLISIENTECRVTFTKSCLYMLICCLFSFDLLLNISYSDILSCCSIISMKLACKVHGINPCPEIRKLIRIHDITEDATLEQKLNLIRNYVLEFPRAMACVRNVERFFGFCN